MTTRILINNARECARDALTLLDCAGKLEDCSLRERTLKTACALLHTGSEETRQAATQAHVVSLDA
jgi:hypothetical protein